MKTGWIGLSLALALAGCDEDPQETPNDTAVDLTEDADPQDSTEVETEDAEPDTGPPELSGTWEDIAPTPGAGDPNGATGLDAALDATQARAGKITAAPELEAFTGPSSQCRIGDFKMYNNRAAFCIEGPVGFTHVLLGGGKPIDAVRLDVPGSVDRFLAMSLDLQLRTAAYETVEVINDGSDGNAAVVRAQGEDSVIALLLGLLGSPQLTPGGTGAQVVTEYRLEPDSEALELVTWISNPEADYKRPSGDFIALEEARAWTPGLPLDAQLKNRTDFFGGVGPGVSYGFYAPREGTALGIDQLESGPATFLAYTTGAIPKGLQGGYRRHLVVGDGTTFSLDQAMERVRGVTPPARQSVSVTVAEANSATPVPRILFEVRDGEGTTVGVAQTDDVGVARFDIEPGEYALVWEAWAGAAIPESALSVSDAAVAITVEAPQTGLLTVDVVEQDSGGASLGPLPAKIRVSGPRSSIIHAHTGATEVALPPGDYTLEISRGLEYTAQSESVTVTAGETATVNAALEHVMPTPGRVAGEFHQHARPSIDSTVPVDERIYANLTDGVDFMAPSDHDVAFDYNTTCADLGISDQLFCLNGIEVSPLFGHINGIGVESKPAEPSRGGLALIKRDESTGAWRQRTPREVVEDLRTISGAGLVQMNHPRDNSALLNSANYVPGEALEDYDAERLPVRSIDMIEVLNGKRGDILCEVLLDWYSFQNQGHRIIAVGNSDSHDVGRPAGFPRNMLGIDAAPGELDRASIIGAIQRGDLSIAAGAVIDVTDATLGETRSVTAGETFTVHVTVSTPPWARVDTLRVVVNGITTQTLPIDVTAETIVDFDADIELSLNDDAYVHFIASGSDTMSAVYPSETPFALTNPIYFDVDGDTDTDGDAFEAPGVAQPLPEMTYDFCNR